MTKNAPTVGPDPVEVVRQYLNCISDLDVDGAVAVVADDIVIEMPFANEGGTRLVQGEAAHSFLRLLPKLFTQMRFYDVVIHGLTATGYVVAEFKSDGITRRGGLYPNRYVALFEVRDGKIATLREYFDPNVLTTAFELKVPGASSQTE